MKNTYLKTILLPVIVLFGLSSLVASALADVAIIVNSASGVGSLSAGDVKKIFLGKKKSFPNGDSATPVEQVDGSATRGAFNDKVLGKSDSQLKSYWSKIIFSGKGSPPDSVADDAAVKSWVAANKSGIGYVDSSQVDGSVKVVLTVK